MPHNFPAAWPKWPIRTRLSWLRTEHNISLKDASGRMGITKGHLWDMESGRSENPRLSTLLSVCEAYHISLRELLEGMTE